MTKQVKSDQQKNARTMEGQRSILAESHKLARIVKLSSLGTDAKFWPAPMGGSSAVRRKPLGGYLGCDREAKANASLDREMWWG
jgi:hypothetical protein